MFPSTTAIEHHLGNGAGTPPPTRTRPPEYSRFLNALERELLAAIQRRSMRKVHRILNHAARASVDAVPPDAQHESPQDLGFTQELANVGAFVAARSTWGILALRWLLGFDCDQDVNEWTHEDQLLTASQRDAAVNDFIELVQGVDALFVFQVTTDVEQLAALAGRSFSETEVRCLESAALKAYRSQYIAAPLKDRYFVKALANAVTREQVDRVNAELSPIVKELQ